MPAPVSDRIYWVSHGIVNTFFRHTILGEVSGLENVPPAGPCILAVNHSSHIDPPLIGSPIRRRISFFARKTLWAGGIASWWLDSVGTIPVDRDGDSDIAAMKRTLQTLREGGLLTLFPEGTRSKDGSLQKAKPGIGLIAAKSQAMVVPCRIFNSFHILSRDSALPNFNLSVHLAYGSPLSPADYDPGKEAGKERFQTVADRIMEAVARLKRPRSPRI